jgi:hypothetical protein
MIYLRLPNVGIGTSYPLRLVVCVLSMFPRYWCRLGWRVLVLAKAERGFIPVRLILALIDEDGSVLMLMGLFFHRFGCRDVKFACCG